MLTGGVIYMTQEIDTIAKALFTINRHAKTAIDPHELYSLKKQTIEKLLSENHAKKIGFHFTRNPKLSKQHSTVLVQVGEYYFHIPPNKKDFKTIEHLGELDQNYRNPKTVMSLNKAKRLICDYLDIPFQRKQDSRKNTAYYTQSSLGKSDYSFFHRDGRKR